MEYKDIKRLNQSSLKEILKSPRSFQNAVKRQEKGEVTIEKEHFIFGRALDTKLLSDFGVFEKEFFVIKDSQKCSDTVKEIIQEIYDKRGTINDLEDKEAYKLILTVTRSFNYQKTYKDDVLVNTIIKNGNDYFKFLIESSGKTCITESEMIKVNLCLAALTSDFFTSKFVSKKVAKENHIQFINRYIVLYEYSGLKFKGELDRVAIDHSNKIIYPIDFKFTGKSILTFKYDFWQYRYDFQAASYYFGLQEQSFIKDLLYNGYKLNNFLYIVVEKDLIQVPYVFEVSEETLKIGWSGGLLSNGKRLEGFTQAVDKFLYHNERNQWDYPKEYTLNKTITIEP
jgi:hypothetical protein